MAKTGMIALRNFNYMKEQLDTFALLKLLVRADQIVSRIVDLDVTKDSNHEAIDTAIYQLSGLFSCVSSLKDTFLKTANTPSIYEKPTP